MKQIERLHCLYKALTEGPQTIESLLSNIKEKGAEVSVRQLYRDLEDVKQYMLSCGEDLETRTREFNRKIWIINRHTNAQPITNYDIDTYFLSKATIPAAVSFGRKESFEKIYALLSEHLINSKIESNGNWGRKVVESTLFYQVTYEVHYQKVLDDILWATAHHRSIVIDEYDGDAVSLYKSLKFPVTFNPVKIIYHRGGFFVAGMVEATSPCLTLDIYQIKKYKLNNLTFSLNSYLETVEKNLSERFGISQNIDNNVYEIELEFSSVTGKYIESHFWHHSQRYERLPNGNLLLKLTCGINRELLGWIFQWMANVKIISPPILIDYFRKQLGIVVQTDENSSVNYFNILQPE